MSGPGCCRPRGGQPTATGNRIPPAQGRSRHYLAGKLDGVQITTIIDYEDELLVSLAAQDVRWPECSASRPSHAP